MPLSIQTLKVSATAKGRRILRILLIDSNESDTARVLGELAASGIVCDAVRVADANTLRQALEQDAFDLALSEYEPDGFSTSPLEIVRSLRPDIPFIFVTATTGEEVAAAAIRAGATDYITKRRLDLLAAAIERAVAEFDERAKRAEAERRRIRLQDEFIGRVGHDLRSPLTAIKASVGVVLANRSDSGADPIQRLLHNIDYSADMMTILAGNLSEMARLQAGREELHRELTDVGGVAARAAKA